MTSEEFEATGQTMMAKLLAVYLAAPDEQKKKLSPILQMMGHMNDAFNGINKLFNTGNELDKLFDNPQNAHKLDDAFVNLNSVIKEIMEESEDKECQI